MKKWLRQYWYNKKAREMREFLSPMFWLVGTFFALVAWSVYLNGCE